MKGRVKAVGGVPAKVEAARRAGLKKVFIPADNAGEGMLCQGIEVRPVETLQQVLTEMLLPPVEATAQATIPQPRDAVPLAAQAGEGKNVAEATGACKR